MENQWEWQDKFNLGVDIIDQEHQRLFRIINKLQSFQAEEKDSQWTCQEGIKYFQNHAVKHFTDEEKYMESVGYAGLATHRSIHQDFKKNILPALEQELKKTDYAPEAVDHFLSVCAGWLIGHTLTEDQAIVKGGISQWEDLLPEEALEAMKKAIVQLVFDMFQLESQVISETYGGERFGSGVYYRLVYGTDQGEKKLEVIMVLEEKLLINTVGRMMGIQTNKLEVKLVNAARYISRQFVGRILECFPAVSAYALREEDLLTYEQFRRIFQQEKPQVSLLFNTGGAGYFSFCLISSHLLQDGIGTPLVHDNAVAEVEHYLTLQAKEAERARNRKKILVVDDSSTMRMAMEKLLGEDYQVSTAESGVAAIRVITLDRPDLILLDYEMPVVDGKQTLEMLRSETAFADIPIFFLTGRSDPGLVRTLLSLKPAGYLLKDLRREDIKQKIGEYFRKKGK